MASNIRIKQVSHCEDAPADATYTPSKGKSPIMRVHNFAVTQIAHETTFCRKKKRKSKLSITKFVSCDKQSYVNKFLAAIYTMIPKDIEHSHFIFTN